MNFTSYLLNSAFLAIALLLPPISSSTIQIDSDVLASPSPSIMVIMANTTSHIVNTINSLAFSSDSQKAFVLTEALKAHALTTQLPIRQFLTLAGIDFTPFWISNQIQIKGAFTELIVALMSLFPGLISKIRKEIVLEMMPTFDDEKGVTPAANTTPWNLELLGAPQAWNNGQFGQGVLVAVLDTGCTNHKELEGKVVMWNDPMTSMAQHDLNGHGTHCSGSIAGTTVGMAPLAKLLVCKCCDTLGCPEDALLGCGQFISCPNPGCTMKPQIASCSWGGGGGNNFFAEVVNIWRANNILPVFALGNSGSKCRTAGSPGDYPNVIGVGAIDSNSKCATFSSRGPSAFSPGTNVKPQVVAPGVSIVSCNHLSPTSYRSLSGTSMATPHIAGLLALMLSNGGKLSYDQALSAIRTSCSHNLPTTGTSCAGISDTSYPNFIYGNGKPNFVGAMQAIQEDEELQQKQQSTNSQLGSQGASKNGVNSFGDLGGEEKNVNAKGDFENEPNRDELVSINDSEIKDSLLTGIGNGEYGSGIGGGEDNYSKYYGGED